MNEEQNQTPDFNIVLTDKERLITLEACNAALTYLRDSILPLKAHLSQGYKLTPEEELDVQKVQFHYNILQGICNKLSKEN